MPEVYRPNIGDERELQYIEEHLLVCRICQDQLSAEDEFVRAFRTAFHHLGWEHVHQTLDGEIRMFVYRGPDRKHIGRIVGSELDCGTWRDSSEEAKAWCKESFRQMFPEHQCGVECGIS
jgi:hypothetical protein